MSNPFDQFGTLNEQAAPAAPVAPATPENPLLVNMEPETAEPVAAQEPNAFDQINAAEAPKPLTPEEFQGQLYDKLNNPEETPQTIIDWSKTVGNEIQPTEDFYKNYAIAEQARAKGVPGSYGKVDTQAAPDNGFTLGAGGAFVRNALNPIAFNFGDETASALMAIPAALRGEDFGEAYEKNWLATDAVDQVDAAVNPGASLAGQIVGIGGSALLPIGPATAGRTMVGKVLTGTGVGAGLGAASAAGDGKGLQDRIDRAGGGALVGGAVGGAVAPVVAVAERLTRPIRERIANRVVSGDRSSLSAFARRLGLRQPDIDDVRVRGAEQQELLGDESVSLIDALDEGGRNVVGAAGKREGGRRPLQRAAEERVAEFPERVQNQADRISPETRSPDELREGITDFRDEEISAAMEPIRRTPLPLTDDIVDVLSTRAGQRAIRKAIETDPSVEGQKALEELAAGIRDIRRSTDPRLPEATQQRLQGVRIEALPFDINASERISRAFKALAKEGGSDAAALGGFARTVRDAANVSPRFREIMSNYGTASRAADAVTVGTGGRIGREQAKDFLSEQPARFEERVDGLLDDPAMIENAATVRMRDGEEVVDAPSEMDLARAGAADTVRTRAGEGFGPAATVARKMATAPNQQRRTTALVGDEASPTVARAFDAEIARVENVVNQVTPSGPSQSAGGIEGAESVVNSLYNPSSPITWLREATRFLNRIGMTDRDAQFIVENATDPRAFADIVNRLEQAGLDSLRAEAYVDVLRNGLVRGATTQER